MQLFNPNFFVYFLFLYAITLISFVTGGIISHFLYSSKSSHFRVFLNLLIGYLFWITLTALFFTKGNTIFILVPVSVLLWFTIFGQRSNKYRGKFKTILKDSKELLKETWFLFFIFILFAIKHALANGYIESDYLFFSNVSFSMKQTGLEGINFGMFTSYIVHPYHYSDMWLTSFITEIFNTNYYHTNIFISIPFQLFIVYSGAIALIKEIGIRFFNHVNLKYAYLFACIIIIIGGLDYPFIREYMQGTISLIQIPKTSVIYAIYILALIFLIRNQIKHAFAVVMLLTVLYTQTVFFILPATGILIFILLLKNYKEGSKYLLYYSVIVGSTFFFYYFNSKLNSESSVISFDPKKILDGLSTFPLQLIKKTIRFSFIYFPFFLLFFFSFKKGNFYSLFIRFKSSNLFLITIIFLFSGYFFSLLFSRALLEVNQDYAQVLYNGFLPLMAIFSFTVLIFAAYEMSTAENYKNVFLKVLLFLIIVGGLLLQHHRDPRYWGHLEKMDIDEKFYTKLAKVLKNDDKIATIQNFERPKGSVDWFQYNYQLYPLLRRTANFNNNGVYFPECINVHELDTTKSEHRKYYYKKSPFIHFMDSLKKIDKKTTNDRAQYLFLKKHNFNYVILPDNHRTPFKFKPLISDSIIRNDGLRIYKLNTN